MQLFVREKSFYKTLVAIALPVAFQNLISFAVSMLDSVMLGTLGDIPLSASSLANQPTFVYQLLLYGVCSGSSVLTAQYWGKKDRDAVQMIFGMAVKVGMAVSLLFSALMFFFPRQLMMVYTDELPVIEAGISYMRLIAIANLLMGASTVIATLLRSVEVVRFALWVSLISLGVNGGMNYVLIFGVPALNIPAMGIVGAAIATIIARAVEFIVIMVYAFFLEKKIRLRVHKMLRSSRVLWKDFIRMATPVAANELMWSLGVSLQSVVLGRMGSAVVSANSIASVVSQLANVFIMGVGGSAGVIVGKTIGAGKIEKAKQYAVTLQTLAVLAGLASVGLVLAVKNPVIAYYQVSDAAKEYANQFLIITAVSIFTCSYNFVSMVGILRSGGDVKMVMLMDIICLWLFTTPLTFVTGLWLKWLPWMVYVVSKLDEVVKMFIAFFRLRGGKWIRNLTREDLGVEREESLPAPEEEPLA